MQEGKPRRGRIDRLVLILAAIEAIGIAVGAVVFPQSLFGLYGQEPRPGFLALLQFIGAADALLGIAYAYSALRLDRARLFIAVGLLAKIAVPIGWQLAVAGSQLTERTLTLIVFDDLVWWLPFGLFLL